MTAPDLRALERALLGEDYDEALPQGGLKVHARIARALQCETVGGTRLNRHGQVHPANGALGWAALATQLVVHDDPMLAQHAPTGLVCDGTLFIPVACLEEKARNPEGLRGWFRQGVEIAAQSALALTPPRQPQDTLWTQADPSTVREWLGSAPRRAALLEALGEPGGVRWRYVRALTQPMGVGSRIFKRWEELVGQAVAREDKTTPPTHLQPIDREWMALEAACDRDGQDVHPWEDPAAGASRFERFLADCQEADALPQRTLMLAGLWWKGRMHGATPAQAKSLGQALLASTTDSYSRRESLMRVIGTDISATQTRDLLLAQIHATHVAQWLEMRDNPNETTSLLALEVLRSDILVDPRRREAVFQQLSLLVEGLKEIGNELILVAAKTLPELVPVLLAKGGHPMASGFGGSLFTQLLEGLYPVDATKTPFTEPHPQRKALFQEALVLGVIEPHLPHSADGFANSTLELVKHASLQPQALELLDDWLAQRPNMARWAMHGLLREQQPNPALLECIQARGGSLHDVLDTHSFIEVARRRYEGDTLELFERSLADEDARRLQDNTPVTGRVTRTARL